MSRKREEYERQLAAQVREHVQEHIKNPTPSDYLYTESAFRKGAQIALNFSVSVIKE
jgi:hypothetical protein